VRVALPSRTQKQNTTVFGGCFVCVRVSEQTALFTPFKRKTFR
jgi:hypothetical protein